MCGRCVDVVVLLQHVTQPGPVKHVVTVYESIDSTTGILNSLTKAMALFPGNPIAPWVAGLAYGTDALYESLYESWRDDDWLHAQSTAPSRVTFFIL